MDKYRLGAADTIAEPLTPILKHFVTERTIDTARTVMTLQGATGYMEDAPWGRFLTHELSLLLGAGAQDLVPQQVGARMLMDLEMKRLRKVGF
jgi:alkylation response protein AidB-like acyl-CoA dehydrogenase